MIDERIIAYLLEELTGEESERFEDECFASESWPSQLDPVEADLIEDYLRGELSPERRERFEQNYLTTAARLERVRMAAALLRHVDERVAEEETVEEKEGDALPPDNMPPGGWFRSFWNSREWMPRAALALIAVAVLAGAWWLLRSRTPPRQSVLMLALSISNGDRAGGPQVEKVKLPPDTSALRISLTLQEHLPSAARYRVELEDASGDKKPLEVTGQDAQFVSVEIPASQLARGPYALKLFAIRSDGTEQRIAGSYFFMVE
jgi:hypothetical protein